MLKAGDLTSLRLLGGIGFRLVTLAQGAYGVVRTSEGKRLKERRSFSTST